MLRLSPQQSLYARGWLSCCPRLQEDWILSGSSPWQELLPLFLRFILKLRNSNQLSHLCTLFVSAGRELQASQKVVSELPREKECGEEVKLTLFSI